MRPSESYWVSWDDLQPPEQQPRSCAPQGEQFWIPYGDQTELQPPPQFREAPHCHRCNLQSQGRRADALARFRTKQAMGRVSSTWAPQMPPRVYDDRLTSRPWQQGLREDLYKYQRPPEEEV
ncbi:Hypothetical protein NTJ_12154 [Nesidiocoris tenuis]|uniref:Uncharacterized protein n=1 Tax=Nesidiocoris tenuis TaxID=355587 RepID=A0ABN7B960_9HEMI|nr:Hypothetical protein NTJ_12154 [Nesidiocoris tenuis]